MKKLPKWRVHIAVTNYHCVDIDDSDDHSEVINQAIQKVVESPDYYKNCESICVSGIFINDYDTKFYYPYIPEKIPHNKPEINFDTNA